MFSPRPQRLCGSLPLGTIPRTVMSEMFNRNAIGVRAHADGVGVKRSNVSSEAAQAIVTGAAVDATEVFETSVVCLVLNESLVSWRTSRIKLGSTYRSTHRTNRSRLRAFAGS